MPEFKKTIWIVNEYNGPGSPRIRQVVLAELLLKNGYDVYILAGSGNNSFKKWDKNIEFVEFDGAKFIVIKTFDYSGNTKRALSSFCFQNKIWRNRKKLPKPDVIISDFAGFFGNVFLKWKKKYGTKVIYDILDLWPEGFVDLGAIKKDSFIAKYLYKLEHKSYKNADGLIFSFEGGKDYIIDKKWDRQHGGDVDISDIGYINNGIDLDDFNKKAKICVLNDGDLKTKKFKAIYLGSISLFNGLEIIVEAAKKLQEANNQDVVFLIYGCGNKEEEIKALAKSYNLQNIVFKGKLDKDYAPYVLKQSDLNLFTFKNVGLLKYGVSPNKLFMYFSSEKPVLSMIKPAYDLVESRKCGISVNNEPQAVADAIVKFTKMDKKEYDTYCMNSKKVAEEYDYKNLVSELIRFIEK